MTSPRTSGSCTTSRRISGRPPISPPNTPRSSRRLQALFHQEAIKYGVYPLDDRSFQRLNATNAGRPDIMAGRTEMTLYPGMTGMAENVFIDTLSRSFVITADLEIPKGGAQGRDAVPRPACSVGGAFTSKTASPSSPTTGSPASATTIEGKSACPKAKSRWSTTSPTTAADRTRAARARSPSTASKSAKAASRRPWAPSTRWPATPPTSAWTR